MVIIIGGGLAGLTCAKILRQAGVEFQLLEAAAAVGGRLQTTVTPDGFHLDHGFQILLDSYPAVQRHLDLARLAPGRFDSGAILAAGEAKSRAWHPLRHPAKIWESATGKYATFTDKFLLGKLSAELLLAAPEKLLEQDRLRMSTRFFLKNRGFSSSIVESFFRPFFGGVLVDDALNTSASLFLYYFQKFIRGHAWLPARGIQEIPRQLATFIPPGQLRLNTAVSALEKGGVRLQNGEFVPGAHLVLATDAPTAARLLQRTPPPPARRLAVGYFRSPQAIYPEKLLVLPAGKGRLVRHFSQITNISPTLAPAGVHLLSATILQRDSLDDPTLLARARAEIAAIYPAAAHLLTPLRVIDVPYAVPAQPPRFTLQRITVPPAEPIILAGDHTVHGSIQGAMESGERAAQALLRRL